MKLENIKIFLLAAEIGNLDVVKCQLENARVHVDISGRFGHTALHYAIENGHLDVIDYLLSRGADIHICDSLEITSSEMFNRKFPFLYKIYKEVPSDEL